MRVLLIFLVSVFLYTPAYTQILALKVGMSEKELVKSAMPGSMEPGMEFQKREGEQTTFRQDIDSTYTVIVYITTKKGKIHTIRKRHIGRSVERRRMLFYYFSEKIKNRKTESGTKENEKLANSVAREFIDKGVRAKAFTNRKRSRMEVFMFYNTKTSSIFIEIEGKT